MTIQFAHFSSSKKQTAMNANGVVEMKCYTKFRFTSDQFCRKWTISFLIMDSNVNHLQYAPLPTIVSDILTLTSPRPVLSQSIAIKADTKATLATHPMNVEECCLTDIAHFPNTSDRSLPSYLFCKEKKKKYITKQKLFKSDTVWEKTLKLFYNNETSKKMHRYPNILT